MKKFILSAAFFAICGIASAQQSGQADQDMIQQEPPRPSQAQTERAATNDAKANAAKNQSQKEVKAEMRTKQKGQTVQPKQPNSTVPARINDTLNPPEKKAATPQP